MKAEEDAPDPGAAATADLLDLTLELGQRSGMDAAFQVQGDAGRDYHALQRENGAFRFDVVVRGGNVAWRPYADRPAIAALINGT